MLFFKDMALVYLVEFRKRGLLHVHILIILEAKDKLQGSGDFDHIVRE